MRDQVFSKVILCGEHAVLRGGMAVVAPLPSHALTYTFEKHAKPLEISYEEPVAPFELLVEGTIEKAIQVLEVTRKDLQAKVHLETLVPLGKGLGGSAALCVFVARLMKKLGFLKEEQIFRFAVELENMFHGETSGVDIAGCLSSAPQSYIRGESPRVLKAKNPGVIFGLSATDEIGATEDCIDRVLRIKSENKEVFYNLDSDMDKASRDFVKALEENDLLLLKRAFDCARQTFEDWKLVSPKMHEEMNRVFHGGALSCKPTGSGLGGYILSAWDVSEKEKALKVCSEVFTI